MDTHLIVGVEEPVYMETMARYYLIVEVTNFMISQVN